MAEKKVLSAEELVKNKLKYKRNQEQVLKELEVERLGVVVVIEVPDDALCLDAINQDDDKTADDYLVYTIMQEPNLKDAALQKEFECEDNPLDIVSAIFSRGEIADIANFAMDQAGFKRGTVKPVKVVETLKN